MGETKLVDHLREMLEIEDPTGVTGEGGGKWTWIKAMGEVPAYAGINALVLDSQPIDTIIQAIKDEGIGGTSQERMTNALVMYDKKSNASVREMLRGTAEFKTVQPTKRLNNQRSKQARTQRYPLMLEFAKGYLSPQSILSNLSEGLFHKILSKLHYVNER